MIWRNVGFIAKPGTPEGARGRGRALAEPAGERAGAEPAASPSASRCWSRPTRSSSPTCSASAWTCSAPIARATRFDPRNSAITPGARRRPTRSCSRCSPITRPARSRCRSRACRPACRSPSAPRSLPDPRSMFMTIALLARAAAGRADARRAAPTRASATSTSAPHRLQRRPAAHAAPALRQPLAPREEGSRRPRCPSRSSRSSTGSTAPSRSSTARRSPPASSSGTRRSRRSASRTRCGSRCSPTTPTSTRSTSAARRSAG